MPASRPPLDQLPVDLSRAMGAGLGANWCRFGPSGDAFVLDSLRLRWSDPEPRLATAAITRG